LKRCIIIKLMRKLFWKILTGLLIGGIISIFPAFLSAEEKIRLDFRQTGIGEAAGFFVRLFQVTINI